VRGPAESCICRMVARGGGKVVRRVQTEVEGRVEGERGHARNSLLSSTHKAVRAHSLVISHCL